MRQQRVTMRDGLIGLALVVVLALSGPARAQQPPGAVGGVAGLFGRVEVIHHGGTEALPLVEGAAILEGDRIRTQTGARVRLVLADGVVLQIGENTRVQVDWVLHALAYGLADVRLEVASGMVRAVVDRLAPSALYHVVTHTAVTSVRGTDWITEATAGETSVIALNGEVVVRNRFEAVAGEVTLGPGQGTIVEAQRPPHPPSVWDEARRQSFIERTTVPAR